MDPHYNTIHMIGGRGGQYENRFPLRDHTWYGNQGLTENTTDTRLIIGKRVTPGRLAEG